VGTPLADINYINGFGDVEMESNGALGTALVMENASNEIGTAVTKLQVVSMAMMCNKTSQTAVI
jgi:hypothetical protein